LTSNRGVFRVNKEELNRFANGEGDAVRPVIYSRADGLPSEECKGFSQPAGWKTRDGRLWFPTAKGAAVIDPARIAANLTAPPVVLERIVVDHEILAATEHLQLGRRLENLEFHFTALSFSQPDRVRFRYRLEGYDQDWTEAGARRVAYYTRIPAGSYRFRVTACNNEGVWNQTGASLFLTVVPPFWASWWFYTLLAAGFAGTVLFIHALRVARLARAQAAQTAFTRQVLQQQEAERRRMAANLHDSFGQDLLVIKNQASLARQAGPHPTALSERLDEISRQATQALEDVRQITHNLRPYQLDRLGLTLALRAVARRMAESANLPLACHVDELANCLDPAGEINLYRIVQEGLTNAVKHSGATEVTVVVRKGHASLRVSIRDNGGGFDPSRLEAPNANGEAGFGLAGMSERARILGGTFTVQTQPGQGCCLVVEVPLPPQKG
jgi:signal transduction histidine kinase